MKSNKESGMESGKRPMPRLVTIALNVWAVGTGEGGAELNCPSCGGPLNLHQPDENLPEQLLAICESCSHWYHLVEMTDSLKMLMIEIPAEALVHQLSSEQDRAGRLV